MYARVTAVQFQPGTIYEAQRIFREQIAPTIHEQPGSKGLLYLADPTDNRALVVTLWDDEDDALAIEQDGSFYDAIMEIAHLAAGPPGQEEYKVVSVQF
ncbi:MAG TPA: antibiotic biosynthesis monooxygenase [Thermomicrobiales bacterium]|nr:antibiotic biosynthesis monooxygenase [Thermomicrobiales bacterium]